MLFYALAGPLIGLLALLVISALAAEWESITHAASILISRAQRPPCEPPHDGIFDFRCYQREAPLRLWYPEFSGVTLQTLSLFLIGAYAFGFVPALLAGFLVCTIRLADNKFGLRQAVVVGTLTGLAAGGVSLQSAKMAVLFFFLCLFATVVCWRLTDRWWQQSHQQGASPQPPNN